MDRDYAESRIREALKASRGNTTSARQQIIAWMAEDVRLLHELTAPHITGIVAHAINRVISLKEKEKASPQVEVSPPMLERQKTPINASPAGSDPFGLEILKAIALGNPAQFGMESAAAPIRKQAASQQHVDAIKKMVSRGKKTD